MFAANVFDHVLDTQKWDLFENLGIEFHLPWFLTKYMVLMLIAAGIILAIFIPLARKVETGEPPKGVFWNFFEAILTFIRDNIAKPYIGHSDSHGHEHKGHSDSHHPKEYHHGPGDPHEATVTNYHHGYATDPAGDLAQPPAHAMTYPKADVLEADRYVPFLWTMFLFILVCNLLGLFPFGGSPTGSITVTGALALITFFVIQGSAIAKMGLGTYLKSQVPNLDLPVAMKIPILLMLVPIEFMGHFIKAFVLAVRLFANIFAGHMVLAMILLFIVMVKDEGPALFWGVTGVTVLGVLALSLLELFVAFLQAYIFTFLTALFLGAALNPEH
ncbi:MAG: F0F1 ATP synthase subunit A [Gemmataceae bacterium]